jgi:hypothetical protein
MIDRALPLLAERMDSPRRKSNYLAQNWAALLFNQSVDLERGLRGPGPPGD